MKTIAVIPARYASTRMPGKPLADVLGKPMIYWVYKAARACPKLDDVLIATDDARIAGAFKTYDMQYIMTSPDHYPPTLSTRPFNSPRGCGTLAHLDAPPVRRHFLRRIARDSRCAA